MTVHSQQSSAIRLRSRLLWAGLFIGVIGLCAAVGYQRAFSTFAEYDDEGYVMLSLKQHLAGGALYDQVYSQYGPAWYLVQSSIHQAMELPVTHDVTRFKTLAIWLLCSVFCGLTVRNLTRCNATSCAAMVFAFLHLDRLTLEPGHPQELCLLAVMFVLAISTSHWARRGLGYLVMAAVCAAAIMTKPNVGALLIASVTLALSMTVNDVRWRHRLTIVACCLIGVAAFAVTRSTFFEPRGLRLPTMVTLGAITVAIVGRRQSLAMTTTSGQLAKFHLAVAGIAIGFAVVPLLNGTTAFALLDGMVLQHFGFADRFYVAAPVFAFAVPMAVATLCIALARTDFPRAVVRYGRLAMLALLLGVGIRHAGDFGSLLEHGLDDRGHAGLIMSVVSPLACLVLVPTSGTKGQPIAFGRTMLAAVAAVQPLIAYPTPGTQMAVGSLPLLLIALVCARDLVSGREPTTDPLAASFDSQSPFARRVRMGLVLGPLGLLVLCAVQAENLRSRLEPLNLNGARRLCVPHQRAVELRALVSEIQTHGDTFVSLHNGYNSLYLLADIEPPTGMNATFWAWMLNEQQQRKVIDALQKMDHVCCIEKVVPERLAAPRSVLADYLATDFAQQATIGMWKVTSRRRHQ